MAIRGTIVRRAACTVLALAGATCAREVQPPSAATTAPQPAPPVPADARRTALTFAVASIPAQANVGTWSARQQGMLADNVQETLVVSSPDGALEPSLAESWQVSADGLTYTFKLHPDVTFHDGTRFDADAAKSALDQLARASAGASATAAWLRHYRGAAVAAEEVVRLQLDRPDPGFLKALAQVPLAKASPTAAGGARADARRAAPVGTGPFRFVPEEFVPRQRIVLDRNPDYRWGPASYRPQGALYFGSSHDPDSSCQRVHLVREHSGPAFLDRVVFVAVPDPFDRVRLLETGAVDAIDELPRGETKRLQETRRYWVTSDGKTFDAANRAVNCLAFDANGLHPIFYDVEIW